MNAHELWTLREQGLAGQPVRCQAANWWSKRNCAVHRRSSSYDRAAFFSASALLTSREALAESAAVALPHLLRQRLLSLGQSNKVFAAEWLDDAHVALGTKCNRLLVCSVSARRPLRRDHRGACRPPPKASLVQIPSLASSSRSRWRADGSLQNSGIHALRLNASRMRLATGGCYPSDVAVYSLPDLAPVCVGEQAHSDCLFDLVWLDDEFDASGSHDRSVALWRFDDSAADSESECAHVGRQRGAAGRRYGTVPPVAVARLNAEPMSFGKVRSMVFSGQRRTVVAASTSSKLCGIDVERFCLKSSPKQLPSSDYTELVCLCQSGDESLVAVGCHTQFSFVDVNTLQVVKDVHLPASASRLPAAMLPGLSPTGVRSISWHGPLLSAGTGGGEMLFYDVRAHNFLRCEHSHCRRPTVLHAGRGWTEMREDPLEMFFPAAECPTAIYAHVWLGGRLLTAGGPIAASIHGNYAATWE